MRLTLILIILMYEHVISWHHVPQAPQLRLKKWLSKGMKTSLVAAGLAGLATQPVQAKVYFDLDTYGDKELKIATVNRIKQKLRNAILQDNAVAPNLFKLAVNDALGYIAVTDEGGPDGSIQFEMDQEGNKDLIKALQVCKEIKSELQRTNSVSLADIVAFAGGEALETVGSSRCIVQVGRVDAKSSAGGKAVPWDNLNVAGWRAAFDSAGLGPKEIALLGGALGECERITAETVAASTSSEDEPDDAEFEPTPFVPSTFGARDNMYGARMGKGDFGNTFLSSVVKGKSTSPLSQVLLADGDVKELVKKYAANGKAFKEDVPEAYLKLTLLGQAFMTRNS